LKTLTSRQAEVLAYIIARVAGGCPPTLREIGDQMGIKSTQGVRRNLDALEDKGYIRREPGARRITVLKETEREQT
jgi:repressor LexA